MASRDSATEGPRSPDGENEDLTNAPELQSFGVATLSTSTKLGVVSGRQDLIDGDAIGDTVPATANTVSSHEVSRFILICAN